jgi:hypothetical protein
MGRPGSVRTSLSGSALGWSWAEPSAIPTGSSPDRSPCTCCPSSFRGRPRARRRGTSPAPPRSRCRVVEPAVPADGAPAAAVTAHTDQRAPFAARTAATSSDHARWGGGSAESRTLASTQTRREFAQDPGGQNGLGGKDPREVLLVQRETSKRRLCEHAGRSGSGIQKRDLAEEVARREMRHRSPSPNDPGAAIKQDVESGARVALPDDRSTLLVLPHSGHLGDRTEMSLRQVREQGSLGQGPFTSRPLFGRDPSTRGHRSEGPSPCRRVDAILLGPGASLCVQDRPVRNPISLTGPGLP